MNLKKITLAALLAAYSCGLPLQAMEINPFKKTGIPTMDQHGTLVKVWETGIQKVIQHNSFVRETLLPRIRKENINHLKGNEFEDPALHFDASPEMQQLGKEAQEKLGITLEQQVPIKIMKNDDPFDVLAKHNSAGIFIKNYSTKDDLNQELKKSLDKHVLFHESAHRKYWDSELGTEFSLFLAGYLPIALSSFYLGYSKRVKNTIEQYIPDQNPGDIQFLGTCSYLISIGLAWAYYAFIKYPQQKSAFIESRADYTALHALDCHICVINCSQLWMSQDSDGGKERKKLGYFPKEDIEIIAEKLYKKNRICDYHAQQKNITQNL
ncbi:MAG: hypothetical protein AB7R69_03325 [Candidatus Babeliales bacterium]